MQRQAVALFLLSGSVIGIAAAQNPPGVVTGSGATLQEDYFRTEASTNDFIDIDGNGTSGARNSFFIQQLALFGNTTANINNSVLGLMYRVAGSGNGIVEFDLFNGAFSRIADIPAPTNLPGGSGSVPDEFYNRFDLTVQPGPTLVFPGDPDHLSGMPLLPDPANNYLGTLIENSPTAGFNVDFAASDVPIAWFTQSNGSPSPIRQPLTPGYGQNPRIAVSKSGQTLTRVNSLAALSRVDPTTVFEFSIALAPVAAIVNYGAGIQQIEQSDLRHLAATGRRINGENLTKVTRDAGSGTRNAFMNGIGLDPSFGVGENVGDETNSSVNDRVGPNYTPSNKGGSSRMEGTLQNTRLGVGHSGASRGVTSTWILDNDFDVLAIRADLNGGTEFVRPTNLSTLGLDMNGNEVSNPANAYPVLGPATFSTVGDPRNAAPEFGGWGWEPDGPRDFRNGMTRAQAFTGAGPNGVLDSFQANGQPVATAGNGNVIPQGDDEFRNDSVLNNTTVTTAAGTFTVNANNPFDGNPAPANPWASAYLNNIFRSVDAFIEFPLGPETEFSAGEALAATFVLPAGGSVEPRLDGGIQPIPLVFNGNLNGSLQAALAENQNDPLADPAFVAFDTATAGRVPFRTTGVEYSESLDSNSLTNASATGVHYVAQNNTILAYGAFLNMRNRIAGDFAFNNARDINDIEPMMAAYNDRIGGPAWAAGTDACIEILGDFNSDGNFNAQDVRYFADGLLLTTAGGRDINGDGVADAASHRAAAFAEVDRVAGLLGIQDIGATGGSGFFRTTFANPGAVYQNGDAAADVAGSGGFTRGFDPIGWDRVIDDEDVAYVLANFGDFLDLEQAVNMDLSCDMNGDLRVDAADLDFVIVTAADTRRGDFNLDGQLDDAERNVILANIGGTGYTNGDLNLDGVVDPADRVLFDGSAGLADLSPTPPTGGAFGTLDGNDISAFVSSFIAASPLADLSQTPPVGGVFGTFDGNDISAFVSSFVGN